MDSCAHFASLKVKTDSAEEQNLLDGIYAPDSDKQQVEHICNLMKAVIVANYEKARDWYPDLPVEYRKLIPKLKFALDKIMDNK